MCEPPRRGKSESVFDEWLIGTPWWRDCKMRTCLTPLAAWCHPWDWFAISDSTCTDSNVVSRELYSATSAKFWRDSSLSGPCPTARSWKPFTAWNLCCGDLSWLVCGDEVVAAIYSSKYQSRRSWVWNHSWTPQVAWNRLIAYSQQSLATNRSTRNS